MPETINPAPRGVLLQTPPPEGPPRVGEPRAAQAQAEESACPFTIQVGALYDGPLDLLLDLIRKQDFNIYDLPIAKVTSQYLAYLQQLKDLDIEVAGEFLLMAATLIQIKSKLLLPADPVLPGETPVDPRDELVQRLLEYEKFKKAAEMLHQKQLLEDASWSRPALVDLAQGADVEPELAVSTFDLVRAFQNVLERLRERPQLSISREEVSVAEMIEHIRRLLAASDEPLRIRALFESARNTRVLVSTFLAVLEMVKLNAVVLRQERMFGDIVVVRHKLFETAFAEPTAVLATAVDYR